MPSAYESADLIIKLYDLRREKKMRKARDWYSREFHPASAQDVVDTIRSEYGAYYRMVTTYWEMAASFVNYGAIDWKMFMRANGGEPINVFAKHEPFLSELNAIFDSEYDDTTYLQELKQLVMQLPHADQQLADRREQFRQARIRWESERGASQE